MQEKKQNISPIKQRILQFVDYLNISKREFYAIIGVSRGTLESNTGITEDVMAKFIAKYPSVNLEWLIVGKGSMLNENVETETREAPVNYNDNVLLQRLMDAVKENGVLTERVRSLEDEILQMKSDAGSPACYDSHNYGEEIGAVSVATEQDNTSKYHKATNIR